MKDAPKHIKEKILMFFLKTSVPRIIEAERKAKKLETSKPKRY
ncbi:hypothetical protein NST02_18015 [Robertmurraya sp. FSL W8-0741]